jgi:hypothetical protein
MSLFAALDSVVSAASNIVYPVLPLNETKDAVEQIVIGENMHEQYGWSRDIEDRIVQFDFQCVRTDSKGVSKLSVILDDLLQKLSIVHEDPELEIRRKQLLTTLFKLIAKTRDVNGGKGEYTLSYMMIMTWHKHFPVLAVAALLFFVIDPKEVLTSFDSQEPYGSWKDMKYFCKYVLEKVGTMEHPLVISCIERINSTLRFDDDLYNSATTADAKKNLTLVSKWVPREGSKKFGFLYDALATNYFPRYMESANYVQMSYRELTKKKALDKCRTQYRMLCSKLNRHLDTVQIKQCAKAWSTIDHAKTTSITMAKQRKAFLNKKTGNNDQRTEDPDRIECADNLRAYLESLKKEGKEVKGKHVGLPDFTKQAMALSQWKHDIVKGYHYVPNTEEADILNSQWRDNSTKKNANGLGPMVAMCDLSGSMSGDPINAAIALSCRVAEKSLLGPRVMTFSAQPEWINLEGKPDFTDMAMEILKNSATAGLNTDFYKALDLMLGAIEQHRVPPADVENMILAIFSDMQIDDCLCMQPGFSSYAHSDDDTKRAYYKWSVMHENIRKKYAEVGMRIYGEPLKPPHILFWNLRSTTGFPALSTEAGCSMMSGYDPTILNMFCELGMEALKDMTPYKNLLKQLDNPRYLPMEQIAQF